MNQSSGRKSIKAGAVFGESEIGNIPYARVYNELRKRGGFRLLLSGTSVIVIILDNLLHQFIGHGTIHV